MTQPLMNTNFAHWIVYPAVMLSGPAMLFFFLWMALRPQDSRRCGYGTIAFAAMLGMCYLVNSFLGGMTYVSVRYDLYVSRLDGLLGFQPSAAVAHFVRAMPPWFNLVLLLTYGGMFAFATILVITAQWKKWESPLKALMLNGVLAPVLYLLCPVSGPVYAFPSFPEMPATAAHPIYLSSPPNGMPSVHFATALLIFWFARRSKIGAALAGVLVALTFIATLGSGEHYLADLVMSFPYAWACCKLAKVRFRGPSFLRSACPSALAEVKP